MNVHGHGRHQVEVVAARDGEPSRDDTEAHTSRIAIHMYGVAVSRYDAGSTVLSSH